MEGLGAPLTELASHQLPKLKRPSFNVFLPLLRKLPLPHGLLDGSGERWMRGFDDFDVFYLACRSNSELHFGCANNIVSLRVARVLWVHHSFWRAVNSDWCFSH